MRSGRTSAGPSKRWPRWVGSPRRCATPNRAAVHGQTTTTCTGSARKSCSRRGWSMRPIDSTDCWPIALGRTSADFEPWLANIHKSEREILRDLIRTTPGEEGKWFAAAKEEGLYDVALAVARSSPCDPRTL